MEMRCIAFRWSRGAFDALYISLFSCYLIGIYVNIPVTAIRDVPHPITCGNADTVAPRELPTSSFYSGTSPRDMFHLICVHITCIYCWILIE
jgi:hypothetical protein